MELRNKGQRDPDTFENGEIVYIQDENGKWMIRCTILNRRKHQGVASSSYMLKKTKTKWITCRNERVIRRFAGNSSDSGNSPTENTQTSE